MVCYMKTTKRDNEHRIWYGVAAIQDGQVQQRLDDLSTDDESVERLVAKLNEGRASLLHFSEIIEDYVAQPMMY